MSNKPTHTAYIVVDPEAGTDKKARWFEIGRAWSHKDGGGFDVDLPPGVTVSGRIVCRKRKEADTAAERPAA
jgi:hypothetical protein